MKQKTSRVVRYAVWKAEDIITPPTNKFGTYPRRNTVETSMGTNFTTSPVLLVRVRNEGDEANTLWVMKWAWLPRVISRQGKCNYERGACKESAHDTNLLYISSFRIAFIVFARFISKVVTGIALLKELGIH